MTDSFDDAVQRHGRETAERLLARIARASEVYDRAASRVRKADAALKQAAEAYDAAFLVYASRHRAEFLVGKNTAAGRPPFDGLNTDEIAAFHSSMMFGVNDEARPSDAEWSMIVD